MATRALPPVDRRACTRLVAAALGLLALVGIPGRADAAGVGAYLLEEPDGTIRDVRVADVDGDGRAEVALLVEGTDGTWRVVSYASRGAPAKGSYFEPASRRVLPLTGALAQGGAIAFANFGTAVFRVFHDEGTTDATRDGAPGPTRRVPGGTLLARSEGDAPVFWDGVGDLDGDGLAETWCALDVGEGTLEVCAGDGRTIRLDLAATSKAASSSTTLLQREAALPTLTAADMDGDGRRELVAVEGGALVVFDPLAPGSTAPGAPVLRLPLPFLEAAAPEPGTLRTPRLQLADVDGDGAADLLVTLVTGRTDKLGLLKTILFHYPGPLRAPGRTTLVAPRARIDTPSVVLHPVFADVDGDGALDYVGDSIRDANIVSLAARMMGQDPPLTLEVFRFDRKAGTFEAAPLARLERTYPSAEALGNTFRANAWFGADLDGDGRRDLLDLGTLGTVTALAPGRRAGGGPGTPWTFETTLLGPLPVKQPLEPVARFGDLDGDGAPDALLFGGRWLYLLVSGGAR